MPLRNLPTDAATNLSQAISCRPGQVSSSSLTAFGSGCTIALFAFSAGETVSEEIYPTDMLYYAIEGSFVVAEPEVRIAVAQGCALAVPSGTPHAIESNGDFKMLQIAVD